MVASLGTIPLANPLQNPVLSGWQQMQQTQYAPLQMMAAPIQALAMANMYGMRGLNYQALAGLNTAKSQVQPTVAAVNTAKATNLIPSQSNNFNNQAAVAQQKAAYIQQQMAAGIPQSQAAMNWDRAFASVGQGVNSYQQSVNNGYGGAMPAIPATPAMPVVPAYIGAPVSQSLGASPPPQPSVINGGAIPPLNPTLTNSISTLQQQIANQSSANPQAATTPPQTGQVAAQPQTQANGAQVPIPWQSTFQMAATGQPMPQLPAGPRNMKDMAQTTKVLMSTANFANSFSNLLGLNQSGSLNNYIGRTASVAGLRRGEQMVAGSLGFQNDPNYNSFTTLKNDGYLSGDGLAKMAAPASNALAMIKQNQEMLDPTENISAPQYTTALNHIMVGTVQDLNNYITGPYPPAIQRQAYTIMQQLAQNPSVKMSLQQYNQEQAQLGVGGSQQPSAQGSVPQPQNLTFGSNNIPANVVTQYAQKYFNGNTANASAYLSQHFGGQ